MAPATYRTRVATRPESEPSSQSAIFGAEPLPQDAPRLREECTITARLCFDYAR